MKKLFNILLSFALLGSFAVNGGVIVSADDEQPAAVQIGSSVLGTNANTANAATVYFGGQTWRVLDYNPTTDDQKVISTSGENRMSLITSDTVGNAISFNGTTTNSGAGYQYTQPNSVYYKESNLYNTINSYYTNIKSNFEKSIVVERKFGYEGAKYGINDGDASFLGKFSGFDSTYFWAFGYQEMSKIDSSLRSASSEYWLRSPDGRIDDIYYTKIVSDGYYFDSAYDNMKKYYDYMNLYTVSTDGKTIEATKKGGWYTEEGSEEHKTATAGVRFGTVLDTTKILLTTSVGAKDATEGTFSSVGKNASNEWKLTLKNASTSSDIQKFTASLNNTSIHAGDDLSVTYAHATYANNQYVSAIITDASGNALYYGTIKNCKENGQDEGTASIKTPSDLAEGNYNLVVFSETRQDSTKYDYSSDLKTLSFVVEKENEPIELNKPKIKSYSVDSKTGDLTITWATDENAKDYTVKLGEDTYTSTTGSLVVKADKLTNGKEYTIEITANPTDEAKADYKESTYTEKYTYEYTEPTPVELTKPEIKSETVDASTGDLTITWATDEKAKDYTVKVGEETYTATTGSLVVKANKLTNGKEYTIVITANPTDEAKADNYTESTYTETFTYKYTKPAPEPTATSEPTSKPTSEPTVAPTPTTSPSVAPTATPTASAKSSSTTKKISGWDDGSPFTTDTCGNVFDRWGNKIYEAKGCNVGGYNLVRTSVED